MSRPVETVGEAVVRLLAERGVDVVFGVPGVHTLELYRGLHRHQVRHVAATHEQGAGFMADGYAWRSGRPGVVFAITGPGVTNTATPVAQAERDSRPLLVISSTVPTASLRTRRGELHDLPDHGATLESLTAFSAVVLDRDELPELIARAFTIFRTKRPRPVHIAIPTDVLALDGHSLTPLPVEAAPPTPDTREFTAAVELLESSARTVILLGGGAIDAGGAAIGVAELLAAPILLTGNAAGAVPADHPLCFGVALTTPMATELLRTADTLLAVGTEMASQATIGAPDLPIPPNVVRIDLDDSRKPIAAKQVSLHGDAGAVLQQLAQRLDGRPRRHHELERPLVGLRHSGWLNAIGSAMHEDDAIALDMTQLAYDFMRQQRRASPRTTLAPFGFGTLGAALPMAIGAKVARPTSRALALAGDGGCLYTITELAAAAMQRIPVTLLVWNNRGYAEIEGAASSSEVPLARFDTSQIDYSALSSSLGCMAARATAPDELPELLERASASPVPTLIELEADR